MSSKRQQKKSFRRRGKRGGRALRGAIIAAFVFPLACGVRLLKRDALLRLANRLATIAMLVDRRGRRVAEQNLRLVYGSRLSDARMRLLVRASYRNVVRTMLDLPWFSHRRRQRIERYARVGQRAELLLKEQGAVFVTAHLGNWELGGQLMGELGDGILSVAMPFQGALFSRQIAHFREAGNQRTVPVKGAVRGMLKELRAGGAVGLLVDQWTEPRKGGVVVDFLGTPACMSGVVGMLVSRVGVPVHVVCCVAGVRGVYCAEHFTTIERQEGETAALINQRVADALSQAIRRHPGQWLWMYRRWKRWIPGEERSRFPAYAKEMGAPDRECLA